MVNTIDYLTGLVAESKPNDNPNKNKHQNQSAYPSHLPRNELLLTGRMPYSATCSPMGLSWTSMWSYLEIINNVSECDSPRLGLTPLS